MLVYTSEIPKKEDILSLYGALGWNEELCLSANELYLAMRNSFYGIYVYDDGKLIATGRIISDGVTHAHMCGIGVLPEYQGHGIGREIINKLSEFCKEHSLSMNFICNEELVPFYKKLGFTPFGTAMKL